jgi:RNA polymerase sigma factor (sigma-70 family)
MDENTNFTKKAMRDYKLVLKAQENKDQKSFNKLMKYYDSSIYFMMLKMTNNTDDAKDLTVEAFEKAFRCIDTYTPVYAFSTWLFKIATNNCIDFLRKDRKGNFSSIDIYDDNDELIEQLDNLITEELNPEENLILEQRNVKIKQVVNKLKPRYKKLVEMHYLKEMGYKEISTLLKLPIGTVKAQLFRARELMLRSLRGVDAMN